MGLSSSINFRASPVDPSAIRATAMPSTGAPDEPSAFERHLDELGRGDENPADRAAARSARKAEDTTSSPDDARDKTANDDTSPVAIAAQTQILLTDRATGDDISVADAGEEEEASPLLTAAPLAEEAGDDADAKAPIEAVAPVPGETPRLTAATTSNGISTDTGAEHQATAGVPSTDAAQATSQAVATHVANTETTVAPPVSDGEAPALPGQTLQATQTTESQVQEADADPEASLAVKSKEGLGHETAARMAEKGGAKEAGTAQTPPTAQAAVAQTAATPAAKPAMAGTTAAVAISAAGSGEGSSTGRLGDLQSVGVGASGNSNAPTIRIGTLPGQTQPTQVPAMAIALQIARNLQNGSNRFDIRLDPPELGRIDVRMEVRKDGTVSAHLTVEKTQTLDLLQRDARALQQALSDAGLQADSDSLNFSLRDQNAGGDARDFSGSQNARSATAAPMTGTEDPIASTAYNINLSATGGVDIRV